MIAEYKNQRRRPKIETKPAKRKLSVYIDIIKAIIADAGIKKPMPILMLSFILILDVIRRRTVKPGPGLLLIYHNWKKSVAT